MISITITALHSPYIKYFKVGDTATLVCRMWQGWIAKLGDDRVVYIGCEGEHFDRI